MGTVLRWNAGDNKYIEMETRTHFSVRQLDVALTRTKQTDNDKKTFFFWEQLWERVGDIHREDKPSRKCNNMRERSRIRREIIITDT